MKDKNKKTETTKKNKSAPPKRRVSKEEALE